MTLPIHIRLHHHNREYALYVVVPAGTVDTVYTHGFVDLANVRIRPVNGWATDENLALAHCRRTVFHLQPAEDKAAQITSWAQEMKRTKDAGNRPGRRVPAGVPAGPFAAALAGEARASWTCVHGAMNLAYTNVSRRPFLRVVQDHSNPSGSLYCKPSVTFGSWYALLG